MKKLTALLLTGVMTLGIGTCASAETSVETIYGPVEVPDAPQRVCVLDASVLDVMDSLGLGEYVTTALHVKNTPSYLEDYFNSDNVVLLQRDKGNRKQGENTETEQQTEAADPYEMYYSIDAELIIGTADTVDEDLYAVLSQLAPTLVLGYAMDNEGGMYAGVKENARTIAAIWGEEAQVDTLATEYDTVYEQLDEALDGIGAVVLNSGLDTGRLQVITYSGEEDKKEMQKGGCLLQELGMNLVSNEAPEEVVTASVYEKGIEAEAQTAKNQVITDWIEEAAPDYVVLTDRSFASLEEAEEAGYNCAELEALTVYKEGRICQLPSDCSNGSGGLKAMFLELDALKAFFLD